MRHNLFLEGSAFRLRPVTEEDAAAIIALRADPELTRFVHPISPDIEEQIAWLRKYESRDGDYYFVVERIKDEEFEGTVAIYDTFNNEGEWGRWVLRPGSLAAPESALLVYRIAFEKLRLTQVYCRTVISNETVLSFHDRCGLTRHRIISQAFILRGQFVDAVEHRLTVSQWSSTSKHLSSQVKRLSKLILRGQKLDDRKID